MDVQSAIAKAKAYVTDIFGPEGAFNVGLEEVQFDGKANAWDVTIGFSRPWDQARASALIPATDRRTYKVVEIDDDDGRVIAVRNRQFANGT